MVINFRVTLVKVTVMIRMLAFFSFSMERTPPTAVYRNNVEERVREPGAPRKAVQKEAGQAPYMQEDVEFTPVRWVETLNVDREEEDPVRRVLTYDEL